MAEDQDEDKWLYCGDDEKPEVDALEEAKKSLEGVADNSGDSKPSETVMSAPGTEEAGDAGKDDKNVDKDAKITAEKDEEKEKEDGEVTSDGSELPVIEGEKMEGDKTGEEAEKQDEEEEDSEDDDDDVKVTIDSLEPADGNTSGHITMSSSATGTQQRFYRNGAPTAQQTKTPKPVKGLDMNAQGNINGQAVIDVNLEALEDKPWRKPGADISDYFNYGLNEHSWKLYCEKQKKSRSEYSELGNGLLPPPIASNGKTALLATLSKFGNPSRPPLLPSVHHGRFDPGGLPISTLNTNFQRKDGPPPSAPSSLAAPPMSMQTSTPPMFNPLNSLAPPGGLPMQFDVTKPPPSMPMAAIPPPFRPSGMPPVLPGPGDLMQLPPGAPPPASLFPNFLNQQLAEIQNKHMQKYNITPQQPQQQQQQDDEFGDQQQMMNKQDGRSRYNNSNRRSEEEQQRFGGPNGGGGDDRYDQQQRYQRRERDDRDRYRRMDRDRERDNRDRDRVRDYDRERERRDRDRERPERPERGERGDRDRDRGDRERRNRRDESSPSASGSRRERSRDRSSRRKREADDDTHSTTSGSKYHRKSSKRHKRSKDKDNGENPNTAAAGSGAEDVKPPKIKREIKQEDA